MVAAQAIEDHLASTADEEMIRVMTEYFSQLPSDRFPNVIAVAPALTEGGADERFEFGLELLIRGLKTYIED